MMVRKPTTPSGSWYLLGEIRQGQNEPDYFQRGVTEYPMIGNLVDIDVGGDGTVLLQMPDIDGRGTCAGIDEPQFGAADRLDEVADHRYSVTPRWK